MTDAIVFDWKAGDRGHEHHATLDHDGIRVIVTAAEEAANALNDPCHPSPCKAPGVPLVLVVANAYADNHSRLAEAEALMHARPARPASSGCLMDAGKDGVPDTQAIADCAAGQVADAAHDARLELAEFARQAARIGITDTAKEG
jgi:hypothetical protein